MGIKVAMCNEVMISDVICMLAVLAGWDFMWNAVMLACLQMIWKEWGFLLNWWMQIIWEVQHIIGMVWECYMQLQRNEMIVWCNSVCNSLWRCKVWHPGKKRKSRRRRESHTVTFFIDSSIMRGGTICVREDTQVNTLKQLVETKFHIPSEM